MRSELISLAAENEQNLLDIQNAISVVVLDDRRPVTLTEVLITNGLLVESNVPCMSSVIHGSYGIVPTL